VAGRPALLHPETLALIDAATEPKEVTPTSLMAS
jgi:hypothetical protein